MDDRDLSAEMDDAQLFAYLDGEADAETAARIEASGAYRQRAKELAKMQNRLKAKLYRHDCPDPLQLGEYHLGLLSRRRAREINSHLAKCLHCSAELAGMKTFLAEEPAGAQPGLGERARVLVARLLSGPAEGLAGQAPAFGLRGESQGILLYEAGEVQVALEIQPDASRPDEMTLLGLITGMEAGQAQVRLVRGGEEAGLAQVDELNNFIFEGLARGEYELIITSPTLELHILSLRV